MKSSRATHEHDEIDSVDVTAPDYGVEVQIRADGGVIWIHVDGRTICRICQVRPGQITINDERRGGVLSK